jgi:hypothetical protein
MVTWNWRIYQSFCMITIKIKIIKLYCPTRPYAVLQNVLENNVTSRVLVFVSFLGSSLKVEAKPQKRSQSREIQQALLSVSKRLLSVIIHDSLL